MLVLENLKEINDVIKSIAGFIQTDESVHSDFEEYMKTIGASSGSANFQSACFTYIFERKLGEARKSILDLYLENSKGLSASTKKIVKSLKKSISSVFEIHKIGKNGFKLYNIINEKDYEVTSLVKMTTFRGMGPGQYVVARVFNYEKEYYLLEVSGVLSTTRRDDVYRFAVAKIIQNPELVYLDNPKKMKELDKDVKDLYTKFLEYFGSDEVVTTNKYADDVIGMFNDFAEGEGKEDYQDKIQLPEIFQFFTVSEFNNSYDNFLENSLGGFSSHKEVYDVGVVYDEELGMYAVPFWGTFNKIFEAKNPSEIPNYDKCIQYFLGNDKFSANLIKKVALKHEDNFMPIVNGIYKTNYTLDELLQKYKSHYLEQKIYSSTTVLYKSQAFSNTLGIIEEQEERPQLDNIDVSKIGRNDPCPCGSGKKFKKCCGASLN